MVEPFPPYPVPRSFAPPGVGSHRGVPASVLDRAKGFATITCSWVTWLRHPGSYGFRALLGGDVVKFDVYIALHSAGAVVLWPAGTGPERTRPKKFKKIGTVELPVVPAA